MLNGLRRSIAKALAPVDNRGGWWPIIRESFPGAFQHNFEVTIEDGLQYWAVFRCISIISADIGKMRLRLVERDDRGIWKEAASPAFSPVIRRPNRFQNRIQFFESWMISKLTRGNAYVLKQRDERNVVTALYVLDPNRTRPMVADNGDVFYELRRDDLSGVTSERLLVPASEIIHDRWNTLYHPLVGLSPLYACGISAYAALRIQQNSARLFKNGARPGGVLSAPGAIGDETAARLKAYWDENFTGENAGRVAVLGDDLKYIPMMMTAVDAQLVEQLKWDDATIAGCFGVPAYMINAGTPPAYNNVEALNQQYYTQCLQIHVESIELCLDEGLGLGVERTGRVLGTAFDTEDLLRMDTATKVRTAVEGLKGIYAPNEARAKFDLPPVPGGDAVYLQQQNFSLEALNKRDSREDPFATSSPSPPAAIEPPAEDEVSRQLRVRSLAMQIRRSANDAASKPAA